MEECQNQRTTQMTFCRKYIRVSAMDVKRMRSESMGDFIRFLAERKYSLFEKVMFTLMAIFGIYLIVCFALAYAVA